MSLGSLPDSRFTELRLRLLLRAAAAYVQTEQLALQLA